MEAPVLIVLLSPLLLLIIVYGVAVTVAIVRSERAAISEILREASAVFVKLVDQMPRFGQVRNPELINPAKSDDSSIGGADAGDEHDADRHATE